MSVFTKRRRKYKAEQAEQNARVLKGYDDIIATLNRMIAEHEEPLGPEFQKALEENFDKLIVREQKDAPV